MNVIPQLSALHRDQSNIDANGTEHVDYPEAIPCYLNLLATARHPKLT